VDAQSAGNWGKPLAQSTIEQLLGAVPEVSAPAWVDCA